MITLIRIENMPFHHFIYGISHTTHYAGIIIIITQVMKRCYILDKQSIDYNNRINKKNANIKSEIAKNK